MRLEKADVPPAAGQGVQVPVRPFNSPGDTVRILDLCWVGVETRLVHPAVHHDQGAVRRCDHTRASRSGCGPEPAKSQSFAANPGWRTARVLDTLHTPPRAPAL